MAIRINGHTTITDIIRELATEVITLKVALDTRMAVPGVDIIRALAEVIRGQQEDIQAATVSIHLEPVATERTYWAAATAMLATVGMAGMEAMVAIPLIMAIITSITMVNEILATAIIAEPIRTAFCPPQMSYLAIADTIK